MLQTVLFDILTLLSATTIALNLLPCDPHHSPALLVSGKVHFRNVHGYK
ncbi:MAG TPA: hypothetical protein VGK24_05935 [Candidatus Angelobacter sp.]